MFFSCSAKSSSTTASSEQATAARSKPKAVLRGTGKSIMRDVLQLLLNLLHVLFQLLIPFFRSGPGLLLGLLLQPLDPLEEPVGEDVPRRGDLHLVVAGVTVLALAAATEVVIIADDTLVAGPGDVGLLAPVTGHTRVHHSLLSSISGGSGGLLDSHRQLVERPRHLGESDDELLVRGEGDLVPLVVSPPHGELRGLDLREDHPQLAHQVIEAGADILVYDKPSHLLLVLVLQENFEGNVVSHCCF